MASLDENGYGLRVYTHHNAAQFKDYELRGDYSVESITNFVKRHSFQGFFPGSVAEISEENVLRFFDFGIPVLLYFREVSSDERQYYDDEVKNAMETRQKDILFMQGDANTQLGQRIARLAGLDSRADEMPQVRILDPCPGEKFVRKFAFSEDFICTETVTTFIDKYLRKELP